MLPQEQDRTCAIPCLGIFKRSLYSIAFQIESRTSLCCLKLQRTLCVSTPIKMESAIPLIYISQLVVNWTSCQRMTGTRSWFLRSDLTRSLLYLKNELGPKHVKNRLQILEFPFTIMYFFLAKLILSWPGKIFSLIYFLPRLNSQENLWAIFLKNAAEPGSQRSLQKFDTAIKILTILNYDLTDGKYLKESISF